MNNTMLTPRAPFQGLPVLSAAGQGVIAVDRDGLGLATVLVRKGRAAALSQRGRDLFGIDLPNVPRYVGAGDVAFVGIAPGTWLAIHASGGNSFASALRDSLGDLASVADQSDGYAVLRLAGPKLRETLAKLMPIDVHASALTPGQAASTMASHINATLWRLEDAADGSPVFEVAVFRSLAASFWHALSKSAAEFGLAVVGQSTGD